MTIRTNFRIVGIDIDHIRVQNTLCQSFEYVIERSSIFAPVSIGDIYSANDHGAENPTGFVLEKKAPAEVLPAPKPIELAQFKFVPGFVAQTAPDAESFLLRESEGDFTVICGQTQRVANGWQVRVKKLQELFS